MWRNSLSFCSKLAPSSRYLNPNRSLLLLRISNVDHGFCSAPRSSSTAAESSSAAAVDRVRHFGSVISDGTIDAQSLAAVSLSKGREMVDLARHYGQCYWELSKARLSMLVVATSGAGYVLGSGSAIDFTSLCYTCVGTMMVAASANTLNQVFEVKNDSMMNRTRRRPLPSGRLAIPHAVTWASCVCVAGTALLASKANLLAAALGASNLMLYAFVYTPLKQIHPVNTWVGAVVGAIPPLLGWAAASGQVSLNGLILPAALYFWQIPHFMALAYLCRDDYAAGGFRMFSLADASGRRTALVALRNCLYMIPLGYLAYDWGLTSGWFCLESTLLTLAISGTAASFYSSRTKQSARRMFHASLLYLPVFMSGLMFHRVTENQGCVPVENAERIVEQYTENPERPKKANNISSGAITRPPVAYASVAPFPFQPAPVYAES